MKPVLVPLAIALLVGAFAADAHAKGFKLRMSAGGIARGGVNAVKSYQGNVLTPAALKDCLVLSNRLDADNGRMEADKSRIDAMVEEVKRGKAELESKSRILKRQSQREVDAFNREVEAYNAKVGEFRQIQAGYNEDVELFNANSEKFNSGCSGKTYYDDDYQAASAALGQ